MLLVTPCTLHYYFIVFFFFNDPATTEIYTLSLRDALPISSRCGWSPCGNTTKTPSSGPSSRPRRSSPGAARSTCSTIAVPRSEEHTSELQSRRDLVCRLLLEKKKQKI